MRWLLVFLLLVVACGQPDVPQANVTGVPLLDSTVGYSQVREIDTGLSVLSYEGYSAGLPQQGAFARWIGKVELNAADEIVGVAANIDADSAVSPLPGIDGRLKSEQFLDATNHRMISFRSTKIADGMMTGVLTLRGVEKEISVPVRITDKLEADFLLDISQFGIEAPGVEDDIRVVLVLVHKQ